MYHVNVDDGPTNTNQQKNINNLADISSRCEHTVSLFLLHTSNLYDVRVQNRQTISDRFPKTIMCKSPPPNHDHSDRLSFKRSLHSKCILVFLFNGVLRDFVLQGWGWGWGMIRTSSIRVYHCARGKDPMAFVFCSSTQSRLYTLCLIPLIFLSNSNIIR